MQKVLIFTYLQRHLKKMLPIINEFKKNPEISLHVILMTQEERVIAEENQISYQMLDDFTTKQRKIDFDLGWGLEPLINAINTIKPNLFLAIEVNYILRNAIRYCVQQKIPNLVVQHGTPNKYSLHAFAPFEGDCFAAWGQFTKDYLVANGVKEEKIVVTGGVPFDRTKSLEPDRDKIAKALGISPSKKWIVFTTQGVGPGNRPSAEEIYTGITETARRAVQQQDYQLIFQVHPGQTVSSIQQILNDIKGNQAVATKYKDTEELMAASDGVITFFSTTSIDAVIMDKPLMLINLTDDHDFLPFVPMKAAYGAYTKKDIAAKFDSLIYDSEELKGTLKPAADYVNYKNDGQALKRVMELCYSKLKPEISGV